MAQALRELEWGRRKCSWGANPISRAMVHDIWEPKRAEGNSVSFSRARGGQNFPIRGLESGILLMTDPKFQSTVSWGQRMRVL